MSESEEFIYEADEGQGGNNRPFLIVAGALLTVFILAAACSGILLLNQNGDGGDATVEAIAVRETENAVILATNAAVTETVAAMETEAAQPTATNTPPPTFTPEPTETPMPTDTPVVADAGIEDGAGSDGEGDDGTATGDEGDASDSANLSGTSVFDEETAAAATSDAEMAASDGDGDAAATMTPIPADTTADSTTATDDALPQTGINTWSAVLAAGVLLGLLLIARRLRTL